MALCRGTEGFTHIHRRKDYEYLFYLVPKSEVMYLYDDYSLRQAMEKMEYHKYSAVPIINRAGNYVGTLTEGDILWELKDRKLSNLHEAEEIMLRHTNRKRDNEPINVNCNIEDLVMTSMNQNFVPSLMTMAFLSEL